MHLTPQAGDVNPTNPCPSPIPTFLPLSSSSCRVAVWVVMILSRSTYSQQTSSPLVPLSFPSLSGHFVAKWCRMGVPAPSGGADWPSWWHLWSAPHVLYGPTGVLPDLQALIWLVDETFFFPVACSVLALRRQ